MTKLNSADKTRKSKETTKAVEGEAKIYTRSDGYYGCNWTATLPDGTKKRIVLSAKTREEVAVKRTEALNKIAKGEYVSKSATSVKTWVDTWLKQYKKTSLSPNTYQGYESLMRNHITSKIGNKKLQELTTTDLQKRMNLIAKEKSPKTAKEIYSILNQCLSKAVALRMIPYNPASDVTTPKLTNVETKKVFTDKDLVKFVRAAQRETKIYTNPAFYVALMLMIETGCRRGEVLGLHWKNVDAENSTVKIKETIIQVYGKAYEKDDPKNKSSIRILPISPETMALILSLKDGSRSPYVFHTKSGKPIAPSNFNRRFKNWCKEAEIKYTPHELRHTFITDMVDKGESIATIQSLTGHSTMSSLLKYTHKVSESASKAVTKRQNRLRTLMSKNRDKG